MSAGLAMRRLRFAQSKPVFLLCDVQERFRSLIFRYEDVIHVGKTMIKAAAAVGSPLLITQQSPKVFGQTVPELMAETASADGSPRLRMAVQDKTLFSMITPEAKAFITSEQPKVDFSSTSDRGTFILFGIEAHVCVQQTALDLLADNHSVILPIDGVSSQRPGDRETALRLLAGSGATLTTTESLLLALAGDAKAPGFKPLANLVKEHNAAHRTTLDRLSFPPSELHVAPKLA